MAMKAEITSGQPASRYAVAMRGLLGMAVLAAGFSFGQEAMAQQPRGKDDPPPIEDLLPTPPPRDSVPDQDSLPIGLQCKPASLACNDPVGQGGARLYARIRRWWRPPGPIKLTTSIWFGDDARRATLGGAIKDTILVAFQLNRDGALRSAPQVLTLDRADHTSAMAAGLARAIERGQPYDMLPSTKYEQWNNVVLRINIVPNDNAGDDRRGTRNSPK